MTALGAGIDYALGWMTAAWGSSLATGARQEQIVRDAVAATCARIPYCAAPDGPLAEILNPAAERTPA
jgi:hypothetical protein